MFDLLEPSATFYATGGRLNCAPNDFLLAFVTFHNSTVNLMNQCLFRWLVVAFRYTSKFARWIGGGERFPNKRVIRREWKHVAERARQMEGLYENVGAEIFIRRGDVTSRMLPTSRVVHDVMLGGTHINAGDKK